MLLLGIVVGAFIGFATLGRFRRGRGRLRGVGARAGRTLEHSSASPRGAGARARRGSPADGGSPGRLRRACARPGPRHRPPPSRRTRWPRWSSACARSKRDSACAPGRTASNPPSRPSSPPPAAVPGAVPATIVAAAAMPLGRCNADRAESAVPASPADARADALPEGFVRGADGTIEPARAAAAATSRGATAALPRAVDAPFAAAPAAASALPPRPPRRRGRPFAAERVVGLVHRRQRADAHRRRCLVLRRRAPAQGLRPVPDGAHRSAPAGRRRCRRRARDRRRVPGTQASGLRRLARRRGRGHPLPDDLRGVSPVRRARRVARVRAARRRGRAHRLAGDARRLAAARRPRDRGRVPRPVPGGDDRGFPGAPLRLLRRPEWRDLRAGVVARVARAQRARLRVHVRARPLLGRAVLSPRALRHRASRSWSCSSSST